MASIVGPAILAVNTLALSQVRLAPFCCLLVVSREMREGGARGVGMHVIWCACAG